MGLAKMTGVLALCSATVLSGCSVAEVRGKMPTTPDECEANWLQEIGAVKPEEVQTANAPDGLVQAFMVRIALAFTDTTIANRRYRACLRSVGIEDVNAFVSTDSDLRRDLGIYVEPPLALGPPRRPAHCPVGASVLYGGAGYCVGR